MNYQQYLSYLNKRHQHCLTAPNIDTSYELGELIKQTALDDIFSVLSSYTLSYLTEAFELAALTGLSLSPDDGEASIELVQIRGTKAYILNLTLKGMLKCFEKIQSVKIGSFHIVTRSNRVSWSGDVMRNETTINEPVKGVPIEGGVLVLTTSNNDQLITKISIREIKESAKLAGATPNGIDQEFIKKRLLQRALKTIFEPKNNDLRPIKTAFGYLDYWFI